MTPLKNAPSPVARPAVRRVRLSLTEAEAAKFGLAARWRKAAERWDRQLARRSQAAAELQRTIASLLAHATSEDWSQKKLAARLEIPETTFRRIRDQRVNPLVWLPKVRAALPRLKAA